LDHRLQLTPDDVLRLPDLPSIGRASEGRILPQGNSRGRTRSDVVIVQLPLRNVGAARARRPRVYQVCADIGPSRGDFSFAAETAPALLVVA